MMDQLFFNKTYNYTYKLYSIKQWEKRSNLDPIVHMVFASNVGQEKKKNGKASSFTVFHKNTHTALDFWNA